MSTNKQHIEVEVLHKQAMIEKCSIRYSCKRSGRFQGSE